MTEVRGSDGVAATAGTAGTAAVDGSTPNRTGRRARWWHRVPAVVWAITGLHIALMVMCTLLYPPFTGYDESWHVDMTWSYYTGHGVYGPGQRLLDRGVEQAINTVPTPPPATPYADAPIPPRGQRPSFRGLDDGRPTAYRVPNQMVQHPPLYYVVEAGLLHAVPGGGGLPFDRQVWLLRMFSMLMVAPMPLLVWATARRLVPDGRVAVLASVLPVTIPNLSRLGGSVNNDDLLILLGSVLLYLLARVVTGDLRKRTGLAVGVVCALAMLTKGFALAFPAVIAAAYGVAWLYHRRRPLAPVGVAALVIGAVGTPWWVRNVVLYHAVQPSGLGPVWYARVVGHARPGARIQDFVPGFFQRLGMRTWGGFGLPERPALPQPVVDTWFVLVVLGALIGIGYGIGRGRRGGRLAATVFVLPSILILGIIMAGSLSGYLYNLRYAGVQGRYLYSTLGVLGVLAAWGWSRLAGRTARYLPLLVTVAGLLTQAAAWTLLLRGWWAPRNGVPGPTRIRLALGGVLRWSPWPEGATFVPFVLVVVLSLLVLGLVVRLAFRSSDGRLEPHPADDPSSMVPAGV